MMNFSDFSEHVIRCHHADIPEFIIRHQLPEPLHSASLYAMTNGGKRVRPLLVASAFATVSQSALTEPSTWPTEVRQSMLAVECLHGYSLVHDDLPCMDDDDLRRGKPTTHIAYGEAAALLAGDVLQTLAFEALSDARLDKATRADLLAVFAPRARRMVIGQMLDINGEHRALNQHELEAIHRDKTGALIQAAVLMGGICAGASTPQLAALTHFAQHIGLAFQVQDDILDVIGDTQQLGKRAGSDEKLDKSTYIKLLGVEAAQAYAQRLFDDAKRAIVDTFGVTNYLVDLADWLWQRQQ